MAAPPLAKAELEFTLQALRRENIRTDGRSLSTYRRFGIRFGAAHGEVEVNFGPTRAVAVCSGEIVVPPPERPNEGRLTFHVEFGPIASPNFEPGRPSMQATAVANFIERLLKGSRAIDAEALCIVGGQKVWSIRVDVRALDDDGNLGDVCAIAALCSLLHFRKADVEVRGDSAQTFAAEDRVPVPLSIHHLPVPVTFALFAGSGGRDNQPTWILDPNRLEEAAMGGALCVAANQYGELCALHKPGGLPVDIALVEHCTELAAARAKELTARIKSELEADLAKRQQARRNVHQHYKQADLLTVDFSSGTTPEAPAAPTAWAPDAWRRRAPAPDTVAAPAAPLAPAAPAAVPEATPAAATSSAAEGSAVAEEAADVEAEAEPEPVATPAAGSRKKKKRKATPAA